MPAALPRPRPAQIIEIGTTIIETESDSDTTRVADVRTLPVRATITDTADTADTDAHCTGDLKAA